jgi:hypothetical protein
MVELDIRNRRMKGFNDIWFMANHWTFEVAQSRYPRFSLKTPSDERDDLDLGHDG